MQERMIRLCGLYENTSKSTGRKYFTGSLSFSSKILVLENKDAKEGEPTWGLFLAEREVKPKPAGDTGGLTGEIPASDYPPRRWARKS